MALNYPWLQRRGFVIPERLLKASYEAAGSGRRTHTWNAPSSGPSAIALGGLQALRDRARAMTRNDPYAFSAIDHLVSSTIGTGITPKPQHPDDQIRRQLQELWDDWTEEVDGDGRTDWYGLQAIVCRTLYESGECFVRLQPQ